MSDEVEDSKTADEASHVETLRDKPVAVVDMVAYSAVARLLEQNGGSAMVAHLNRQIEHLVGAGLAHLDGPDCYRFIARTGDGAVLMFETCEEAYLFAAGVHEAAEAHNTLRTEFSARRFFRIGIACGDVTWDRAADDRFAYAGITIANAVRLETAAAGGETVIDTAVYERLPDEMRVLFGPEQMVRGKRDEVFRARRSRLKPKDLKGYRPARRISRRAMLTGAAAAGLAGATAFEWPRLSRMLSGVPRRRFVALTNWPVVQDATLAPLISGLVDAVGNELVRAEAYDHDLLVIPRHADGAMDLKTQFAQFRDVLGTNLVLAVGGESRQSDLLVTLRLLDGTTAKMLRETHLTLPFAQQISLLQRVVAQSADLLGVSSYVRRKGEARPETSSPTAYTAFQAGEQKMKEDNDTGLDGAIEKYKEAVELDPQYAAAHAKLGAAYFRYYVLHGDAGALTLARDNCTTALTLDPNSVPAHVALSSVLEGTGDEDGAAREIAKALAIDPRNPRTLTYQAESYARLNTWEEAEDAFQHVLTLRPNYWLARNELGMLYFSRGRYREALGEFQAESLAAPRSSLAFNNVGAVYARQGRLAESKTNLDRSLSLLPTSACNNTLASLYRFQGKSTEAVGYALEAVRLDPEDLTNWIELGDCYLAGGGQSVEVQEAYAKGASAGQEHVKMNPRDGPAYAALSLCLAKTGNRGACLQNIATASSLPSSDVDSLIYQARTLFLLSFHDRASAILREIESSSECDFLVSVTPDLHVESRSGRSPSFKKKDL